MLLLLVACSGQPAEVEVVPDPAERIEVAREALADAGVSRLRWGMTPFEDAETAAERWRPLWDHVGDSLGVEVEVVLLEPYDGVEDALRRGEIDGATFRPWAYVDAREDLPMQLICTHVVGGAADYGSYVFMLEDQAVRDVEGLEDLAGSPMGFVHPKSTSGFVYPASMLLQAGVHPLEDLEARWYYSHAGVFDAVADGKVLAGAVYSDELRRSAARNPGAPSMRIVAKSERIPYSAYVLREGLPEGVAEGVAAVLNGVTTQSPEGRELLRELRGINGFLPVSDGHYDVVRGASAILLEAEIDADRIELPSGG